jgi:MFS family permease
MAQSRTPREEDIKRFIQEGSAANIMGSLAGGAFLTGLALYLGASDAQIGLLSSLPPLATLVQLLTPYLVRKMGNRKKVTLVTLALGRLSWIIIALMPIFLLNRHPEFQFSMILGIIIASTGFNSIGSITWWAWMRDFIPREMMGKYFSRRNLWAGLIAITASYLGSVSLDLFKNLVSPIHYGYGFSGLFLLGIGFGVWSIYLLTKIPDWEVKAPVPDYPALKELAEPLKDRNFMLFVVDRSLWSFSVFLAAPFFNVYLLKYLHASWSYIGFINLVASLASLYCITFWGNIIDHFGNKSLLVVSCFMKALYPIIWLFAWQGNYFWLLIIPQFLSAFDSAINLTANNLTLKLSPQGKTATYVSVSATIINLSSAAAPLLASWMLTFCDAAGNIPLPWLGSVNGIKILFVASASMRFFSSNSLSKMHEPESRGIRHIFKVLKEVKGIVPSYSELDQSIRFWFRPLEDMRTAILGWIMPEDKDKEDEE